MATTTRTDPRRDAVRLLGRSALLRRRRPSAAILAAVREGFPYSSITRLARSAGMPEDAVLDLVGISPRTAARRRNQKRLTAEESDRLYRVSRIIAFAASVLGEMDKARTWLERPNRALGGQAPLSMLDTDLGAREIEEVLTRLAHGIFS